MSRGFEPFSKVNTYLIVAGLEGAPGAVEGHLHWGEGQIGHKIFATLCITVLHLKERRREGKKTQHLKAFVKKTENILLA